MVRPGNVRLDISIPKTLCSNVREILLRQGRLKKGCMSDVVSEALEEWMAKNGFDRIQESVRADLSGNQEVKRGG